MCRVYWLEQVERDLPAEEDWLSAGEALCLRGLRIPKRRADWRLGRWTAKRALAAYWRLPADLHTLAQIEIRPAPSGAPQVFFPERPAVSISLSHRCGTALCAVAPSGTLLGCDLEAIEPRSPAFIAEYFTEQEQELIARADAIARCRLPVLLWSAKESALKALGEGLRLDTREVTAIPLAVSNQDPNQQMWSPLQVCCRDGRIFAGWWREQQKLLRTLVASPPPLPPLALETPRCR